MAPGAAWWQGGALYEGRGGRRTKPHGANAGNGRTHGRLARRPYAGRYLPSGHLVYVQDGTLFAAPFDLDRLMTTGPAVPALEGLASNPGSGGAQFAVSTNGTLVYLRGQSISGVPMHWIDRDGKTTPLRDTPANWGNLLFAPDGRRFALHIIDGQPDISGCTSGSWTS